MKIFKSPLCCKCEIICITESVYVFGGRVSEIKSPTVNLDRFTFFVV